MRAASTAADAAPEGTPEGADSVTSIGVFVRTLRHRVRAPCILPHCVTRGYDAGFMARPQNYSPTRRFMMQGIMWIILGATVGLAALVSHHRRSAFEVKLAPPITYRGVTVQLPKGWKITR